MTSSERERRIEAVTNVLYGHRVHSAGVSCAALAQEALDAADEAGPMVSLAAVIDILNRAYHPQMGENPTHPADVIRASFSGEEGTET